MNMSNKVKNKLDSLIQKSFNREPFFASTEAESNFEKNTKECHDRPHLMKSHPARVRLELTNACNFNCTFCYRPHFKSKDRSLLEPADIDRLSPFLKTAKFISLTQKAEPLMSPHIIPILDKMLEFKSIYSLYTNGYHMNEDISEALIRNRICFVSISVSAYDEDNYARFYRGGKFSVLEENLHVLTELKKKHKSSLPRLRISYVLRKDTIPFLDDALAFAKKYNFNEGIQILLFFRYIDEDRNQELIFEWEKYQPMIDEFVKKAEKERILVEVSVDKHSRYRPTQPKEYMRLCYEPWESINVTPGGNLTPCSQAGGIMGNIRKEDVWEIWNNARYQEFRRRMREQPFNKDCVECWHCRYVSPLVTGEKVVRMNKIFDTFYRKK